MNKVKSKLSIIIILSLLLVGSIIYGVYHAYSIDYKKKASLKNGVSNITYNQCSPDNLEFYENAFKFNKRAIDLSAKKVIGGIIPHHLLAADMIAELFHNISNQEYDNIILIGPNHFSLGTKNIITSRADWQTPYGILEHDSELLKIIIANLDNIEVNDKIVEQEHAISSEIAFIKRTFPEAKILPLILNHNLKQAGANKLGEAIRGIAEDKKILVLASVDFSHYKDNKTAQADDRTSINAISNYLFDKLYDLDIDSPPTIATLLRYTRMGGAEFQLLNNSNSALLLDKLELENTTSYVTGFFVEPKIIPKQILPENKDAEKPIY